MNMQGGQAGRGSLLNNLWVQLAALAIVVIILIVLAAKYLW